MYLYYIICALVFIIAIMICFMMEKKKEYDFVISKKDDKINKVSEQCEFYKKKCESLKDVIGMNKEFDEDKKIKVAKEPTYDPIYKGKKALIGDYFKPSYMHTKKVLESLGFIVTVALTSKEVIERINNGEKYDVIFSNNIYNDGTGPECLTKLKQIKGFNIPVIIHTITRDARERFVNEIGFDDYIEKPVNQEDLKPILKKFLNKEIA